MQLSAGMTLALVDGTFTDLVIAVLAIGLMVVGFLLWRTLSQKRLTEEAAARLVSMSEDLMSLSSLPLSRKEAGSYRIEEKLYESVGSITYRGRDKLGNSCDIKIPTSSALEDKMTMARLEREARVLESIENPNVVRFRAFERIKDRGRVVPLLVTEALDGEDLTDLIKREAPLPPSRVIPILEAMGNALAAVHRNEVVHRNVKPASIRLTRGGRIVLYNFGVAQADDSQALTQRGDVLGTGLYMSPEQITGKALDGRSDLYSLGVVAYEMLTGRPPHAGVNFAELVMKKMTQDAPHPGLVVPGLPPELDDVISRLMEKDPARRPHSAGALLTELQALTRQLSRDAL